MDFSKLSTSGDHAKALDFSKAVELQPGERVDVSGLSNLKLELYWESTEDGDLSAVLLGEDDKAVPKGIVYYAQKDLPGVSHSGDCLGDTDGDPSTPEEVITIKIGELDASVKTIVPIASTHSNEAPVPFGKLRDCKVLVINADTDEVLYGYEMDEDFSTFTSVSLCKIYERKGKWMFANLSEGVGKSATSLVDVAAKYDIK